MCYDGVVMTTMHTPHTSPYSCMCGGATHTKFGRRGKKKGVEEGAIEDDVAVILL